MDKNRVTVYVGGRRLVLVSSDTEENVQKIAQRVNERFDAVTRAYPQLDARGCAVLTALDFADDEQKALGKKAELVHQADKILKQADKHSKQIIELKRKNTEIEKQYDLLMEQYEDLKQKNYNLTTQYNELKKFLDKQVAVASSLEKSEAKTDTKVTAPKSPQKPPKQVNSGKKPEIKSDNSQNSKPQAVAQEEIMTMQQYSLFEDNKD